jgi:DNA (cytosine-5)-methyltransferase 1
MKYGSVCSGIEAASVAWHDLGWEPQWFSEIEQFPSEVLKHQFPMVPNLGDMTTINQNPIANERPIDLLVGGTPCQSFSVAGLRKGLDDPRGNLMLAFLSIADKFRPKWVVWENVPGVLSSNGGKDFGTFLGALGELGYGFAYRVLDAQHFGVAQRRRRVFVVGYLGDWRVAAAVLFERESLQGNTKPSRKKREEVASDAQRSVGEAGDAQPIAFKVRGGCEGGGKGYLGQEDQAFTISATQDQQIAQPIAVLHSMAIRRLTPKECERLQGFPDDWTKVPYRNKEADQCPDGPRYKACGNSMAVPVMRWIGQRIQLIEKIINE